jgi:hypothetical protein
VIAARYCTGALLPLHPIETSVAPNGQGHILLEFKPVENYAMIYAIEAAPEPKQ